MANQLFPKGAGHLLDILISSNVKVLVYDAAVTTTWEFVSDLTAGDIVARSGNLSGKTNTNGVFDANDVSFVAAPPFSHLILFIDSGSDATSEVIAVWDASWPGGDVNVIWNPSGLFSIA